MSSSILLILSCLNVFLSLATGIMLEYVFKDLSKNPGFLIKNSKSKQFMVLTHMLVGLLVGALILPIKYDDSESVLSVQVRPIVGCLIFIIYTVRNFVKHPKNLITNLSKYSLEDEYTFFRSSVTRQQMQLLLGLSISCILGIVIIDIDNSSVSDVSVVFLTITGLSWLQIIAQFANEHTNTSKIRQRFRAYSAVEVVC